jgi:hypothetical protein
MDQGHQYLITFHIHHSVRLIRLLDERIAAFNHFARFVCTILRHFLQRLQEKITKFQCFSRPFRPLKIPYVFSMSLMIGICIGCRCWLLYNSVTIAGSSTQSALFRHTAEQIAV